MSVYMGLEGIPGGGSPLAICVEYALAIPSQYYNSMIAEYQVCFAM